MKKILSFVLALVMLVGMMPGGTVDAFAAEETRTDAFEGKTLSILGDSISTFSGVSNSTSYNSTLGSNAVYYSAGTLGVYRADTWWQQTVDALGMELLVNNSWSGSCVLPARSGTVGAYVDRCVNLHNDTTGEEPDVIVVFLGTNDFSYYQSTLGTADIDYDTLITDGGYAAPTTTCEAYAIMLDKMLSRYPDAEIYCMGMTARRSPDKEDSILYCVITDAHGNQVTTETVSLRIVEELAITRQPEDASAILGQKATVSVEATGYPLTYSWYFREAGAKNFRRSTITSATYTLTMTEARNGRQLYCVITDAFGNQVTTETVTLYCS